MILVGGVGELYQGDLDLGRHAAERLAGEHLGHGVLVEDLHYGALAVGQFLEELRPEALVLVGAAARGRRPGSVERRRIPPRAPEPAEFRRAVEQAGTGHVSIDLLLEVAAGLGVLPPRTVTIEVEPARVESSEALSPQARRGLSRALQCVRREVRRIPLFQLADRLRERLAEERIERAPALSVMEGLLEELRALESTQRWGACFSLRDELRLRIATGETGAGMTSFDWAQWWALIEELDRLQAAESVGA